jgi:hypothetical protein
VQVIRYPLPLVEKTWSLEDFEKNPSRKIIQVGWWMQRPHAIHALPASGMEKLWIRKPSPGIEEIIQLDAEHLKRRFLIFDHMLETVTTVDDLPSEDYERLLCENIAFAHYYDAKNFDLLTQCIARHTPLLINALPGVREYLGDGYPLYYYSYDDAASKASDRALILDAHQYLLRLTQKSDLGPIVLAQRIHKEVSEGAS